MGSHICDASVIHDDNTVSILNRRDTLCNNQLGRVWNLVDKCLLNHGIGFGIHSRSTVIQDQNSRFLQKRSGNTDTLFLSAGYIGTSLFNVSVILIREGLDKVISLSQLACMDQLFLCGIWISPA